MSTMITASIGRWTLHVWIGLLLVAAPEQAQEEWQPVPEGLRKAADLFADALKADDPVKMRSYMESGGAWDDIPESYAVMLSERQPSMLAMLSRPTDIRIKGGKKTGSKGELWWVQFQAKHLDFQGVDHSKLHELRRTLGDITKADELRKAYVERGLIKPIEFGLSFVQKQGWQLFAPGVDGKRKIGNSEYPSVEAAKRRAEFTLETACDSLLTYYALKRTDTMYDMDLAWYRGISLHSFGDLEIICKKLSIKDDPVKGKKILAEGVLKNKSSRYLVSAIVQRAKSGTQVGSAVVADTFAGVPTKEDPYGNGLELEVALPIAPGQEVPFKYLITAAYYDMRGSSPESWTDKWNAAGVSAWLEIAGADWMTKSPLCLKCKGTGEDGKKKCATCKGSKIK